MRSARRVLTGLATTVAVTAAMVGAGITGAAAAPSKPVISQIISSGGTFTTSPAAGTELNPKVTVTGVVSGDTVSIYVGNGTAAATCTATASSVVFNKSVGSNCSVPATFNVGAADGDYILTADRVSGGQSPRSDAFEYIRDTGAPAAPASVTATKHAGATIQVQFPTALDTAPFASGIGSYNVYRSQANPPGGAGSGEAVTTNYSVVGSVPASSCSGSGSTACSFTDPGPTTSVAPANGSSYFYKVTAVDVATNEGPKSPASNYVTADGSAPTAPSGLTIDPGAGGQDPGFGHNTSPKTTITLGGEASTIQLLINNVVVDTESVPAATTTFIWNNSGAPIHPVSFGLDGTKNVRVTAADDVGNTSTSPTVTYELDTHAPNAPTMSVSNAPVGTTDVTANDATPQIVVSGASNLDHLTLNVDKVNSGDPSSTDFSSVSDGNPRTYNPDGCELITSTTPCDFTLSASPHNADLTASIRDRAGNVSTSNPLVHYHYDNVGPAVSTIESMAGDTSSPASGTDRTPEMIVRVSSPDTTRVDIFRGSSTTAIGSLTVSGHTVACPTVVASTVCVEFNKLSTDADFIVGAGANVLKARAFDAALNFRDSNPFEWDGTDTQAPAAPAKPTFTLSPGGSNQVDWNAVTDLADGSGASSNPVHYDLQRASAAPTANVCPDPNTLTFTPLVSNLADPTYTDTLSPIRNCYFYRVRAVDGAGNASAYSTISDAAGDRVAPTTPDAPTGVVDTGGQVSLDWNTVTDPSGVTYNVYKASAAPTGSTCPASSGLVFNSLHPGLTSSDDTDTISPLRSCNYYKIEAVDGATNSSGLSAASLVVGDLTPPADVNQATVAKRSAGHNLVTWGAVADPAPAADPVTYELDRATANPGTAGDESSCPASATSAYSAISDATALSTTSYTDTTATNGKCTYYEVIAHDNAGTTPQTGNASSPSPASAPVLVDTSAGAPTPSITSVNGDPTSPAYSSSVDGDKPTVIASVTEGAGTLRLFSDGTQVASKTVSAAGAVSFLPADYLGGASIPARSHVLTVDQVVNSTTSALSSGYTYARPPLAPTITTVAGIATSPATASKPQPSVIVSNIHVGDTVRLYASNCSGGPSLVAQRTSVPAAPYTIVPADWTTSLAIGTYCLTAVTVDPAIADSNFSSSPASSAFTYDRKPVVSGYVLDGNGGMHPVNGGPVVTSGPYFNFDIARDVVMLPNGTGGFILDGYGGIHPFGIGANPRPATPSGGAYFNGFDIARAIVLRPGSSTQGYVLDGYGGVHPFGGAAALSVGSYFNGHDIARRLVMTTTTAGYVLDGYGGIHPFGGATPITGTPYYAGFDIARDLILSGPGRGYELDGYGGVHAFGGAPSAPGSSYTSGSDIARTIVMTEPDLDGGLVLDAYGKMSTFGDAIAVPRPATFPSPAGRRLVVTLS